MGSRCECYTTDLLALKPTSVHALEDAAAKSKSTTDKLLSLAKRAWPAAPQHCASYHVKGNVTFSQHKTVTKK